MPDARPRPPARTIAAWAALVAVGVLAGLWLTSDERRQPPVAAVPPSAAARSEPDALVQVAALAGDDGSFAAGRSAVGAGPAASVERAVLTTPPAHGSVTLVARFTRPDASRLQVDRARIELRDDASHVARTVEVQQSETARVQGLAPGRYTVRVEAPGLEHRAQVLDLTRVAPADRDGQAERVHDERLMLWPADWVAVVVESGDGQGFSALAEELGHDPRSLYVGAFGLHAGLAPPREDGDPPEDVPSLARFHPPPGYQSWELHDGCIGSLELLHPPPVWVGLDVLGAPAGWELLLPGRTEIVFRLDRAALEQRLARVVLRVVDAASSAPVEFALVTLRADTSAQRRTDLTDVPSGGDGRVEFADVVPGRYELTVTRGESQHQAMIELQPFERRDLGDITVADAAGIDVLVLDEAGRPVSAYLEIGPYEQGLRTSQIYPQMLRHRADALGRERLPMPSGPAIVRATREAGRSNGAGSVQEVRGARSANVLLDPATASRGRLHLVLAEPCAVRLSTRQPGGARIEVLDELDLVVARSARADVRELEIELVPGRYRARCLTPDEGLESERPFVVGRARQDIGID